MPAVCLVLHTEYNHYRGSLQHYSFVRTFQRKIPRNFLCRGYLQFSLQNMHGSNKKPTCQPPQPKCSSYENGSLEEDEDEGADLYEPPPCDLESRAIPCVWNPQQNHSLYSGCSVEGPSLQKPPIPNRAQQSRLQQRTPVKQARPPPPSKRPGPLPIPDRRMSLPCTALRSPPIPSSSSYPHGMDDLYLTLLDTPNMNLESNPWYGGEMERKEAERALRTINKDGCFLVRQSSTHPYTLAVLYHNYIYNIPIRAVGSCGFSLGKEGKRHEEVFPSVVHLIEHYKHEQLYLVNRQTMERESTSLLFPALL
ncbi:SH2 domain-containing protein 6 [Hyperolius riggenbachi]|uniref:SH2 domain-containing protein 6 n=1 Tax=Hyperolius riggenbachi TaxID=752182 RepID=UPI0035A38C2A